MTRVKDFFTLKYGHSLELNRLEKSDGADAVNFVSRTARNNGVSAKVRHNPNLPPAPAGTITVALGGEGGAGTAFLQPFPYYCGRDVMVLTPKKVMTEQELLWWAACITANRFRFGFGRQANRTLKDIVLPDPASMPSWVLQADTTQFDGFRSPVEPLLMTPSNPALWKEYSLGELFIIRKGKRLTKAKMTPGGVPFIGAIDSNNGISGFVSSANHAANTITVNYNGSVAEAFYQPIPFWACDDVNVLYPRFNMSPKVALFLCTLIRREKYRFSYGRKWHLERMETSVIKLPSKKDGAPDWSYMENYIKTLPYSSQIQ